MASSKSFGVCDTKGIAPAKRDRPARCDEQCHTANHTELGLAHYSYFSCTCGLFLPLFTSTSLISLVGYAGYSERLLPHPFRNVLRIRKHKRKTIRPEKATAPHHLNLTTASQKRNARVSGRPSTTTPAPRALAHATKATSSKEPMKRQSREVFSEVKGCLIIGVKNPPQVQRRQ